MGPPITKRPFQRSESFARLEHNKNSKVMKNENTCLYIGKPIAAVRLKSQSQPSNAQALLYIIILILTFLTLGYPKLT